MKTGIGILMTFAAATSTLCSAFAQTSLEDGFRQPPQPARPQVWYHLMNGNVSREGLVKDLDAMAAVGLGGLTMFDADRAAFKAGLFFTENTVRQISNEERIK